MGHEVFSHGVKTKSTLRIKSKKIQRVLELIDFWNFEKTRNFE